MLQDVPTGQRLRNGNKAVVGVASEAFVRWLHRRYSSSNCHWRGHLVSLHDTFFIVMFLCSLISYHAGSSGCYWLSDLPAVSHTLLLSKWYISFPIRRTSTSASNSSTPWSFRQSPSAITIISGIPSPFHIPLMHLPSSIRLPSEKVYGPKTWHLMINYGVTVAGRGDDRPFRRHARPLWGRVRSHCP